MDELINSQFAAADGEYRITKLLGKGKSGAAYLMERGADQRVLKVMHHEAVAYYRFGDDKLRVEVEAYHRLNWLGIRMPALIEYNAEREFLIKEYVSGSTAAELSASGRLNDAIYEQLFTMARVLAANGLNIDYFPTNFIVDAKGRLYYIDYETNPYMDQWNLPNWGIWYWVNAAGMKHLLETGDGSMINADPDAGIPHRAGLEAEVARLTAKFGMVQ